MHAQIPYRSSGTTSIISNGDIGGAAAAAAAATFPISDLSTVLPTVTAAAGLSAITMSHRNVHKSA